MVTSPTGKGVSVIGGSTEPFEFSKAMFELSRSMEWTRLEQTLKIEHFASLAIPIANEFIYNKVESEDINAHHQKIALVGNNIYVVKKL